MSQFAFWIENKPVHQKTLNEWRQTFWPAYQNKCEDICRNIYIMNASVEAFELYLQKDQTWKEAIENKTLWTQIDEICESACTNTEEFFGLVRPIFESRCKSIYDKHNAI